MFIVKISSQLLLIAFLKQLNFIIFIFYVTPALGKMNLYYFTRKILENFFICHEIFKLMHKLIYYGLKLQVKIKTCVFSKIQILIVDAKIFIFIFGLFRNVIIIIIIDSKTRQRLIYGALCYFPEPLPAKYFRRCNISLFDTYY